MRDDFEFNAKFCELIEMYPQLYDYTRSDYCNRSVQEKVWQKIAAELNETVNNCKGRWNNIRGRYSKYKKTLRSSDYGAKQVKEYYLAAHLLFLDDFLKTRPWRSNLSHEDTDAEEADYNILVDADYQEILPEDTCSSSSEPTPAPQQSTSHISPASPVAAKRDIRKRKAEIDVHEMNESDFKYYLEKQTLLEQKLAKVGELDADMAFLHSILPDMKAMTAQQKRKLKIGVLKLSDQILEQRSGACESPQPPLPSHQ